MSHDEQPTSFNEQFKHLKTRLLVKKEREEWANELDRLVEEIREELFRQGQDGMQEKWRGEMIKLFGAGYSRRNRTEPLNACIKNKRDFDFLRHCLEKCRDTLRDPTEEVRLIYILVLEFLC